MSSVIKVQNVSKQYRLGDIGTGSLSHDLNRFWHRMRGKEDPYLKIGETNDRTSKGESEYVWSLRDVSFDINQGDAVGIIGRNGAGKSTLLKLLSRVTVPTTGIIKVKGRIASLLEVGTGFHPDLSGRDNIYLNGAILGMRREEIKRKFDEIVAFAGVERYVDTPVKRYSSGMYVRLAFAVAAHLESEILIVDEVLAVGDSEFQKKCIGKMNDVSKSEGRTVLFVSHNMPAILSLCTKGVLLANGKLVEAGNVEHISNLYLSTSQIANVKFKKFLENPEASIQILEAQLLNESISYKENLKILLIVKSNIVAENIVIGVGIDTLTSIRLITVENLSNIIRRLEVGEITQVEIEIENHNLAPGTYVLSVGVRQQTNTNSLDYKPSLLKFEIETSLNTVDISDSPHLGTRPASSWNYKKP